MSVPQFEQVAVTTPDYSRFNLSHDHKLSMRMGRLVPVNTIECLPGDSFNISFESMFRMMPMVAPPMHRVDVCFYSFFVPNRILWPGWEKFIFPETDTAVPPAAPYIELTTVAPSSLANYLGVPVLETNSTPFRVSALPFAAYHRIYQEWFRSEDLQQPVDKNLFTLVDGAQDAARVQELVRLANRGWERDYFTACLPNAQKGGAVGIPIDVDIPITWKMQLPGQPGSRWKDPNGGDILVSGPNFLAQNDITGNTTMKGGSGGEVTGATNITYDPMGSLYAEGDQVQVNTVINDLRTAWALQQWLEKNMRAGSRYREGLQIFFNQRSSDARLQRPEYIGGSKGTMAMSEVLQTQASQDTITPQGNMAGHGISVTGSDSMYYKCEEHGFIITLCCIIPKTAYYQGLPRFFSRFDRYSYPFPDFANLGEQTVKNKEIFLNPSDGLDENDFGYIPRFSEMRTLPSRVSGQMATTLDFWHMARKFATRPALNSQFIECIPDDNIFAVDDDTSDNIVGHIVSNISVNRALPVYGIPAPLV